ncbi:MAG: hypothetical protein CMC08_10140 [Flavobacteriaceae bacterium]|nr:hypothetical protein [Flavobacteriaceae bacterium]
MLRFFGKIRKRLLTKNLWNAPGSPVAKYLLYALGEIVLVVIGILIALQINTWNENRKNRIEERTILQSLAENLSVAKRQSERFIAEEDTLKSRLIRILGIDAKSSHSPIPPIPDSIFKSAVWDLQSDQPTFNAYANLKNTNKLSLIKNKQLNERFTDLEFHQNKLNDILEDRLSVHQIRIDDILENDINFIPLVKANIREIDLSNEPSNNYRLLVENTRIRNLLGMKLAFTQDVLNLRANLDEEIEKLSTLIAAELQGD